MSSNIEYMTHSCTLRSKSSIHTLYDLMVVSYPSIIIGMDAIVIGNGTRMNSFPFNREELIHYHIMIKDDRI